MAQYPKDLKHAGNWGTPREICYLAFAALPISIYALAMVILEQGGFRLNGFGVETSSYCPCRESSFST
jgi:hypothetical protein